MNRRNMFRARFVIVCGVLIAAGTGLAQSLQGPTSIITFTATSDSLELPDFQAISLSPVGADKLSFKFAGVSIPADGSDFIVVSPSSGVAPAQIGIALNPAVVPYLPPGNYQAGAAFASPDQPSSPNAGVGIVLAIVSAGPPAVTSIASAASLQPAISPGDVVSIFGTHIGTPPVSAKYNDAGLYPTTLGNSTVTFNGVLAPLLYVSTGQINAAVPYEVAGQKNAQVIVTHNQSASPAFSVPLLDTSPAIFTVTQSGGGQGAILNDDPNVNPTPNSADNPAAKGIPITIFATGGGLLSQTVQDGSIALIVLEPPFFKPKAAVSVTIGGQPAEVIYAGADPYEVMGMLQVNAVVPSGIGSGPQPAVLSIGDQNNASQKVTVAVK